MDSIYFMAYTATDNKWALRKSNGHVKRVTMIYDMAYEVVFTIGESPFSRSIVLQTDGCGVILDKNRFIITDGVLDIKGVNAYLYNREMSEVLENI